MWESVVIVCLIYILWYGWPCISLFGTMVIFWYTVYNAVHVLCIILFLSVRKMSWNSNVALYTGKIVCIYETEQQQSKTVTFVLEDKWSDYATANGMTDRCDSFIPASVCFTLLCVFLTLYCLYYLSDLLPHSLCFWWMSKAFLVS